MGAGDEARKILAPGKEFLRRRTGDRNGEDRTHGGPHGFHRERVGGLADQDQALRADRVDGADDGAEIAGVADAIERHPDIVAGRADIFQRQIFLGEHADHHLRIVAPRDRRQHLLADFEHQPAGRDGARGDLLDRRIADAGLGEHQRLDRPAEIERVDDQLQSFGEKGVLLVAKFLQRQRLDVLDQRVGEAGDLLDLARRAGARRVHAATQRENSDVDSARPADFSRMTSSPDSTTPPMPAKVSRISAWIAKNDALIE